MIFNVKEPKKNKETRDEISRLRKECEDKSSNITLGLTNQKKAAAEKDLQGSIDSLCNAIKAALSKKSKPGKGISQWDVKGAITKYNSHNKQKTIKKFAEFKDVDAVSKLISFAKYLELRSNFQKVKSDNDKIRAEKLNSANRIKTLEVRSQGNNAKGRVLLFKANVGKVHTK